MDFELTGEQLQFRKVLRSFFEQHASIEEMARLEEAHEFPSTIYSQMAEIGLTGLVIPEEYGGNPADSVTLCLAVEEISRAGATLLMAWIPTVTCSRIILDHGTDDQRLRILPGVVAGTTRMAVTLTEPEAGSDLTHLKTSARRDGDEWVINGQKVFITGADTADYLVTLVRTADRSEPGRGLTMVLVPRKAAGVSTQPLRKLAGQGTHTCEVFFDEVRVPASETIGEVGDGLRVMFQLLDHERITCAAQSVGVAAGALDLALTYARERRQFDVPIIEHQSIAHLIADMAIDVEMARLFTWRAAWRLDQGLPASLDASMAKVAASEASTRIVSNGMQVLGGYSYMVEYGMERYWRETKLNEIVAGTNQIQRSMIARQLGRSR
ncbi:acyl-CoA dehydrogenase [Nocardioides endophyticus]|uniref:Acyl-CoA dehydrogenase n=1 Tax=Nocardioides endophyticus TaxID=1353775 RepID=A0ABP8YG48_9ACTN